MKGKNVKINSIRIVLIILLNYSICSAIQIMAIDSSGVAVPEQTELINDNFIVQKKPLANKKKELDIAIKKILKTKVNSLRFFLKSIAIAEMQLIGDLYKKSKNKNVVLMNLNNLVDNEDIMRKLVYVCMLNVLNKSRIIRSFSSYNIKNLFL